MASRSIRHIGALADKLPSYEQLDQFGTMGMLALIHDAIGHVVTPIHKLPEVIPILERMADALINQQGILEEVLAAQGHAVLEGFAARRFGGVSSLPHSVLKRDLRFVSVSESYCDLFGFSLAQLEGLSLNDLLHPADIRRFSKVVRPLLAGMAESCELVEWRATGSHRFVLTKDTLWGIGRCQGHRPQYIATVSEKLADGDDVAMLVKNAKFRIHGPETCRQRAPRPRPPAGHDQPAFLG